MFTKQNKPIRSKKIKVTVLWYAVLCSLVNILHYMASRPRRQFSLETTICTYAILSHGLHNSASLHIHSLSCVQFVILSGTNTLHSYTVYETTIFPFQLYGSLICSLSVSKERILECGGECFIQQHMNIWLNKVM
jgi:hypothetical protein